MNPTAVSAADSIDRLSPCRRPTERAIGHHVWHDLAFLHWRCEPAAIEPLLPQGLSLDTWQGEAWVGLVPFRMTGVRPWWSPSVPGISAFAETNVRTYVHVAGREPGVWFFSLDAASTLAVLVARWRWGLSYYRARMAVTRQYDRVHYRSRRLWPGNGRAEVEAHVRIGSPIGANQSGAAAPGTLEYFLVERYVLYTQRRGELYRGRVHHRPYQLHEASVQHLEESVLAAAGVRVAGPPCHALFSPRVDVEVFPLRSVE